MDPILIESTFINHFRSINASTNPCFQENLENLFEKQITDQDNEKLQAVPNEEEIYCALKQIPNHKAPSPDGMTTLFYRCYWSSINKEVVEAVQNFFRSGKLLK